jgi:hypothetical protein
MCFASRAGASLSADLTVTPESFSDLKDHLDLFIKKMQRPSYPA